MGLSVMATEDGEVTPPVVGEVIPPAEEGEVSPPADGPDAMLGDSALKSSATAPPEKKLKKTLFKNFDKKTQNQV